MIKSHSEPDSGWLFLGHYFVENYINLIISKIPIKHQKHQTAGNQVDMKCFLCFW